MPPVRSSAFERHACIVVVIFLFGEIILTYSYYIEKKLVYIIIIAPSNCQFFFNIKCTKLNIYLSYNIKLVFNAEYIFISLNNIYRLSQLLGKNI